VDCSGDFGPFDGETWLNCSHQGPLPRVAVAAAEEAIRWKVAPSRLTTERFGGVPARLRGALGRLIGAPAQDVILANSASYGLHLLANGLPLREGDEVLLVKGDFPSVVLPWLGLERRGVSARLMEPPLTPDALRNALTAQTRALCTTWVHSFTGRALDLAEIGSICRERRVDFLVNGAQAVGARPIDVSALPVDALISVGHKYLCGPYGTGFCWIRPELLETLELNQAYWLAMQTADDLGKDETLPSPRADLGARRYDVFATANFLNFVPWTASVEYLLERGIAEIARHDADLVDRLVEGLARRGYDVLSPRKGPSRTTLVLASHPQRDRNADVHRTLLERDVHTAFRRGNLRFSPHLYNTAEDVDRALDSLP
jgi:selenocysteine lyase/cysteine desulfurase